MPGFSSSGRKSQPQPRMEAEHPKEVEEETTAPESCRASPAPVEGDAGVVVRSQAAEGAGLRRANRSSRGSSGALATGSPLAVRPADVSTCWSHRSRPGRGNGDGRGMTPSTRLKMAVEAPIPSASVAMVVTANPGVLRNWRAAIRRSCRMCHRVGECTSGAVVRPGNPPCGAHVRSVRIQDGMVGFGRPVSTPSTADCAPFRRPARWF